MPYTPFDDDHTDTPGAAHAAARVAGTITVLKVDATAKPITRLQRKFNNLVEKLNTQRQDLSRWQAYRLVYQEQLGREYQPLTTRLREKRFALAQLFDRTLERETFAKRDREKVRDILLRSLTELLTEAPEPHVIALYDKYSERSYDEGRRAEMEVLRSMAGDEFGVDVDAYQGAESPEDLADWLKEQIRENRANDEGEAPKQKSAKAAAKEALKEESAEGGTRAVREIFRKLASELHPDRESDPVEQIRKTELMQRVNQAYKAGDLLSLLELQLSVEQIDATTIAGLAEDRLKHYLYVLEEQSKQLRDELDGFVAPFAKVVGDATFRKVTPDAVQRVLEADIRAIRELVRTVDSELIRFRDVRLLKQSLVQYLSRKHI